jgi:hypothetical protein
VRVNGAVEGFGQVARELCLRLLIVFDRLASIEPGAPDILQVFLSRRSRGRAPRLFISRPL